MLPEYSNQIWIEFELNSIRVFLRKKSECQEGYYHNQMDQWTFAIDLYINSADFWWRIFELELCRGVINLTSKFTFELVFLNLTLWVLTQKKFENSNLPFKS